MPRFAETLRRNRRVIALFGLIVLLPAAVFSVLIVRAVRSDRVQREYETAQRQRQLVRLAEADLANWLFSSGADSARAKARVHYRVQGDRVAFPDLQLSVSAGEWTELRPFDAAPPNGPITTQSIVEQYFPRIQAFRRDVAAGRTGGAQYFRQLRALVVQPPAGTEGYVVDIAEVLAHVNARLAEFTAGDGCRCRLPRASTTSRATGWRIS
jgi:hypothetical protein